MLKFIPFKWIGAILALCVPWAASAVNLEHENSLRLQRIMVAHQAHCDCTVVLEALADLGKHSPADSLSHARAVFGREFLQQVGRCSRPSADDLDLLYDTVKTHNRGKPGSKIAMPDKKTFAVWARIEEKFAAPVYSVDEALAGKDGWMALINAYYESVRTRHEHFHLASLSDLKKSYESARQVLISAPKPFYAYTTSLANHIKDVGAWEKFKSDQLKKLDRLYRFKIERVFNKRDVSATELADWEANVKVVEAEFAAGPERVAPPESSTCDPGLLHASH